MTPYSTPYRTAEIAPTGPPSSSAMMNPPGSVAQNVPASARPGLHPSAWAHSKTRSSSPCPTGRTRRPGGAMGTRVETTRPASARAGHP